MANRTTLVDNNTWNNSHIALVGKAMSSTEDKAYKIMRTLGVDYVLVIFGGMIGYSGDDINKFLWMVRIAQGEHPNDIKVRASCRGNDLGCVGDLTFSITNRMDFYSSVSIASYCKPVFNIGNAHASYKLVVHSIFVYQ